MTAINVGYDTDLSGVATGLLVCLAIDAITELAKRRDTSEEEVIDLLSKTLEETRAEA